MKYLDFCEPWQLQNINGYHLEIKSQKCQIADNTRYGTYIYIYIFEHAWSLMPLENAMLIKIDNFFFLK
jgi:hypothetical protein